MLINLITLLVGILLKLWPVSKNTIIGYKSTFAKKNEYTWNTANSLISNLLILIGIASSIFILIYKKVFGDNDTLKINLLIVFISIIISMIITEIYLRIKFKSDGSYRNKD